jgi:hypothetical protein
MGCSEGVVMQDYLLNDLDTFEKADDFQHPEYLHDAQDTLIAGWADGLGPWLT